MADNPKQTNNPDSPEEEPLMAMATDTTSSDGGTLDGVVSLPRKKGPGSDN